MSNVVGIHGAEVPTGEPVKEVVAVIEEMLAKAKTGKIVGVAMVVAEIDPVLFETAYFGAHGSRHTLAAGVLALGYQFGKRMTEIENQ